MMSCLQSIKKARGGEGLCPLFLNLRMVSLTTTVKPCSASTCRSSGRWCLFSGAMSSTQKRVAVPFSRVLDSPHTTELIPCRLCPSRSHWYWRYYFGEESADKYGSSVVQYVCFASFGTVEPDSSPPVSTGSLATAKVIWRWLA